MTLATVSRDRAALAAICLSALMLGLEITSIPAILPADFRQLQWIMNAYTIAMTTWLMAMGALADRFGRKRLFMIGTVVFGITSVACGLAPSAPLLIGARFLQGTSAAAMLACQVAALSHQFPSGRRRAFAFGWWGIVFGAGLGFGPIVGGFITAAASWQWVFLIHGALALATLGLASAGLGESTDPHAERIDLAGMATLSLAVFCLVYLITQGEAVGRGNMLGLAAALAGSVSFLAFLAVESRVARPMFDFRAFRIRPFAGALVGASGMNFSFWPFVVYLPIYVQAGLGHDGMTAGLILLAYTLPALVVPPLAERLLQRHGPAVVIPLGLFIIGMGFVAILMGMAMGQASWMTLVPGCVIAGIGLGLTNTPVTNTATGALPAERSGMASGMDMSARMISLAVNIAVMGFVLLRGIAAGLDQAVAPGVPAETLWRAAEAIAAGDLGAGGTAGLSAATARQALERGFAWVTLYGAAFALGLSGLSLLIFGRRRFVPAH